MPLNLNTAPSAQPAAPPEPIEVSEAVKVRRKGRRGRGDAVRRRERTKAARRSKQAAKQEAIVKGEAVVKGEVVVKEEEGVGGHAIKLPGEGICMILAPDGSDVVGRGDMGLLSGVGLAIENEFSPVYSRCCWICILTLAPISRKALGF
ncbi:MAG: hypothetical protein M1829_006361 [Trizodia sp. TS-e1964]|nr:MAG: hypothetical protein M1829_006361 [Trizodia sp. TS-e1964]